MSGQRSGSTDEAEYGRNDDNTNSNNNNNNEANIIHSNNNNNNNNNGGMRHNNREYNEGRHNHNISNNNNSRNVVDLLGGDEEHYSDNHNDDYEEDEEEEDDDDDVQMEGGCSLREGGIPGGEQQFQQGGRNGTHPQQHHTNNKNNNHQNQNQPLSPASLRTTNTNNTNTNSGVVKRNNYLSMTHSTLEENGLAVFTWGRGEDGQLGLGDTADQDEPTYVDALRGVGVRHMACGSGHTVVLTTDGEIFTWGRGDDGRLGHGGTGWKYVPRLCQSLTGYVVTAVTCGSYHTAAVTSAGDLWTWGGGMYGKLGHGNEAGSSTPKRVEALVGHCVTLIACGSRHTAVVLSTGALYSWGDQDNGVAGHGDINGGGNGNNGRVEIAANHQEGGLHQQQHQQQQQQNHNLHQYLPRLVERLAGKRVVQLSACGFHTGCLTDIGECFTWGEGKFGRLGHNSESNSLTPRLVESLQGKNPRQISCGGFHTAVVTELGHLYTFGGGEHGQLGHNDRVNKLKPTLVQALENVFCSQITCGWSHSVALDAKGRVYTWGNSDHGKLGHGSSRKVAVPQMVKQLRDYRVVRVASYNEHTAVLVEPYLLDNAKASRTSGMASRSYFTAVNAVPVTAAYTQQIRSLVNDDEFSDVTFMIENEPIYAHRAILAQRCEHFAAMFRSGMRESNERSISIPNISKKVFLLLLEYLYIDTVKIDIEHAIELYSAADLYHMERLRDMCCTVVRRNLSAENSGLLLQTAAATHCHVLKEICMNYVVENFDTVSKTEGIKHVSHTLLLEILAQR